MPERTASERLFVVTPAGNRSMPPIERLAARAPEIASTESLPGAGDACLVSLTAPEDEPREAWRRLQDLIGEEARVDPVLVDEEGHHHFPTGTIQVRFLESPSDEDLESFARTHHLRLIARNKYEPAQSSFERTDPGEAFLPDRVREVAASPEVETAWEEARAHYRRL